MQTTLGKTLLQPKLEVFTGGMFAGKSTALIAKGQRHMLADQTVVYVKPDMDDRYSEDEIVTHDGKKVPAISITTSDVPLSFGEYFTLMMADVILFDEVQFFGEGLVFNIQHLLSHGKTIYCSGLDMDYKGKPFETTATLLAMADEVHKLKAVCSETGQDAGFTVKVSGGSDQIELGSSDKYKPVSRAVFYEHLKELEEGEVDASLG